MNIRAASFALAGVALAIAITATMDANGLTVFSALPLIGLTAIFWILQRPSRVSVGLTLARPPDYLIAVAYPLIVLSAGTAIAIGAGAAHPQNLGSTTIVRMLIAASVGILAGLLTEEGFFRGWLWASLVRAGFRPYHVVLLTSVAFALWHISYVTLAKGYTLPPAQIVVFITNAALMGVIWGMLRAQSGSIVVSSVSHSVWNAVAYGLFGEGPKIGALGITQTSLYGAEIGVVGLALNAAFALVLLRPRRKPRLDAQGDLDGLVEGPRSAVVHEDHDIVGR
jgi:hypothetical protein